MPKSILIVDDSERVRASIRHFLEGHPELKVCGEAVDGLDALEKALQLSPDLIILDLQMPGMDGLQAARELRTMEISVPIILFTMYAEAVPLQDAVAAGVNAVVSKTNPAALRQHIENLLN